MWFIFLSYLFVIPAFAEENVTVLDFYYIPATLTVRGVDSAATTYTATVCDIESVYSTTPEITSTSAAHHRRDQSVRSDDLPSDCLGYTLIQGPNTFSEVVDSVKALSTTIHHGCTWQGASTTANLTCSWTQIEDGETTMKSNVVWDQTSLLAAEIPVTVDVVTALTTGPATMTTAPITGAPGSRKNVTSSHGSSTPDVTSAGQTPSASPTNKSNAAAAAMDAGVLAWSGGALGLLVAALAL